MATSSHHVACLTDDPAAVHSFLTEVIGLPVHRQFRVTGSDMARFAGWPPSAGAEVTMYGTPPAGIVEVVTIPEELRPVVHPRQWLVSFATADLDRRIEAARRAGFDLEARTTRAGEDALTVSMVDIGGISWELVQFGR